MAIHRGEGDQEEEKEGGKEEGEKNRTRRRRRRKKDKKREKEGRKNLIVYSTSQLDTLKFLYYWDTVSSCL